MSHVHTQSCSSCQLCVNGLNVRAGGHAILTDVELDAQCKEITAIIGPNGAGKSTFLRALLGLVPYTGHITFPHTGERPKCGYVPQYLPFDQMTPMTVRDVFRAALQRRPIWCIGKSQNVDKQTVQALKRVGAEHLLTRRLGRLSGGELQRVMLAMALEPLPGLLLLDEPVSGVDAAGIRMFYELVDQLRQQWDIAVLMVSHDMTSVARVADRVLLLNGTVLAQGTPKQVMNMPAFHALFGKEGQQ